MNRIVVDKNGNGDFRTVGEAFSAALDLDGPVEIFVHNGIYREKLEVVRDDVTIIGESTANTVLTYNDHANIVTENGSKLGTMKSASVTIDGNDIVLKNLTIANDAGNGRDFGQAVALRLSGDRIKVEDCSLIGAQDTLYVAPKPECPQGMEMTLTEPATAELCRMYFKKCYIEGDVDFIFGGATAFFEECEIFSRNNITEYDEEFGGSVKGYVGAPCTWRGNRYGFVFDRCDFKSDCPDNTVYLGRPWRIHAKMVLLSCNVGTHINTFGWHDWDKPEAHGVTFFAENNCKYAGSNEREEWIRILSDEEAREYTKANILWEEFGE